VSRVEIDPQLVDSELECATLLRQLACLCADQGAWEGIDLCVHLLAHSRHFALLLEEVRELGSHCAEIGEF